MQRWLTSLLFLVMIAVPGLGLAQTQHIVPPGKAIVVGPFGPSEDPVAIESFEAPDIGSAYLSDSKSRLIYVAPKIVETVTDFSLAYKLAGASAPDTLTIRVDPNYSAAGDSATVTALEWLVVLFIIALFIEAAVLVFVAVIRAVGRMIHGPPPTDGSGFKPSVYKPIFALILSGLAVFAFGIDPLNDIMVAFGNVPSIAAGEKYRWAADGVITALLLAGGAESVRRIAIAIQGRNNLPDAADADRAAEAADNPKPAS